MALKAVILDLDGTLIDTNRMHARAFAHAFQEHGFRVGTDRIEHEIGKGGSFIVPDVLGAEAEDEHGDAIRDSKDERFEELVEEEGIPVFPSAPDLLRALQKKGLVTAIATGSKQEALDKMMQYADTDLTDLVDEVITDSDVERSKPHPDAVTAAVDKLNVSPVQCMMLGDTPYDGQSSRRAGVVLMGVLTGVHSPERMRQAGARGAYQDPGAVLENLDEVLALASPGAASLTASDLDALMAEALSEARQALEEGELPVGSVLAHSDGTVVARGHSRTRQKGTSTAHAEIEALEGLADHAARGASDLVLVTTLEPCVMCLGAAMEEDIDTIVYGLEAPPNGGTERCQPLATPGTVPPRLIGNVLADESRELLARWSDEQPGDRFVTALLEGN